MIINSKQKITLFISIVLVTLVVWVSTSVKIQDEDYITEYFNSPSATNISIITVHTTQITTIVKTTTVTVAESTTQETTTKPTTTTKKETTFNKVYSGSYFQKIGVINWGGWRWTWYSERVLPGNGLNIKGRHTDDSGYVCDQDNYICLSSSTLKKGTIIDTPFGKQGKVYDCGCATDTIDVYVNW